MTQPPDWVIVRDNGLWLVGKRDILGPVLTPVFELRCNAQQTPDGGVMLTYNAVPMLLLASLDTWRLSESANVWPLRGASMEKQIREAIERGQGMVQAMRVQQAGLVLAREMPPGRIQ